MEIFYYSDIDTHQTKQQPAPGNWKSINESSVTPGKCKKTIFQLLPGCWNCKIVTCFLLLLFNWQKFALFCKYLKQFFLLGFLLPSVNMHLCNKSVPPTILFTSISLCHDNKSKCQAEGRQCFKARLTCSSSNSVLHRPRCLCSFCD